MEFLKSIISEWGYVAVFLGSLVEGESVILTASAMAEWGLLNIYTIFWIAFTVSAFADQTLFFIGRHYGPSLFDRYPKVKPGADRAFKMLHKYDFWFIFFFRFVYGIRTISPVVIGAGGIKPSRFIPINIAAAFIWAAVSCWGGYMLGDVMQDIFDHFYDIQRYIVYGVVALVVLIGGYRLWKRKKTS